MRKTDTEKFANLIMMYQDDMYYLALSICKNEADAQDIVGETIVKAFEARNQLRNDARFKYWIMKILTNTAYTYLKRKKRLNISISRQMKIMHHFSSERRKVIWLKMKIIRKTTV